MDNETVKWAGRIVVGGFGLAFVAAVVIMAIQVWTRVKDWWRKEAGW